MSVLNTTFTDSAARLVKSVGEPSRRGFKLFRKWQTAHSNNIDTLGIARVFKKSYKNPWADNDTTKQSITQPYGDATDIADGDTSKYYRRGQYVGKFIHSGHQVVVNDDNSFDVIQELTRVKRMDSWNDLKLYEYTYDYEDKDEQPFSIESTRTKVAKYTYRYCDTSADSFFKSRADSKLGTLAPTGYGYMDRKIAEEEDGTHTYTIMWGKATASNDAGVRKELRSRINPNVLDIDSVGKGKLYVYDRVGINNIDTLLVAKAVNDSKFVTQEISATDNGDGSATVRKSMDRYNTIDTFYFNQGTEGIGWHSDNITRIWPRIKDTKAVAITAPGGKARLGFKQGSDSYRHSEFKRDRKGDGTSDVIQIGENPKTIYSVGSGSNRKDCYYQVKWGYRTPSATNNPWVAAEGEVKIVTSKLETSNDTSANAWAKNSSIDLNLQYREGYYRSIGNDRYESFKVRYRPAT